MFDIAVCQFVNFNSCILLNACKKVPLMEQESLNNEYSNRKMIICIIAVASTNTLRKKMQEKVVREYTTENI